MRVFVAGASGVIGRSLVPLLVGAGHEVTGMTRRPERVSAIGAVADLERQVLDAGGTVLRYGFFYGPGTQFASDGFYAELARKRRFPVLGSGEGRWSFIHVADAAAATVAALERGNPGVYNIV